jgi:hypothetical protein
LTVPELKDAFKLVHDGLKAELDPVGPLEEGAVHTLARHLWRKQNLSTYRKA